MWLRCIVFFMLICASPVHAGPEPAQKEFLASIDASIGRLQERYGISFKYAGFPRRADFLKFLEVTPDGYGILNEYLSLFEEEITKYPPGFFKDQDIRGIGLVTHLFTGQIPAQGLFSPEVGVMFFDVSRFSRNKAQQRHGIHHEIFHMMFVQKGDFPLMSDEVWGALNSPGFSYGRQAGSLREPNPYNYFAPREPGFATYYAMESVREDQAEIFACLMLEQNRKLIEKWMVNDPVLAKKVEAVKAFADYYHPGMKEIFENRSQQSVDSR